MSRDYHFSDRREFIKNAALIGSAYPFLSFGADSKKSAKEPKAKSIIHIFLPGTESLGEGERNSTEQKTPG